MGAMDVAGAHANQETVKLLDKLLMEQRETNRLLRKMAGEGERITSVSDPRGAKVQAKLDRVELRRQKREQAG